MSETVITRPQEGSALIARIAPYGIWVAAAAILIVLPAIFRSGTALTMMSLMGIAVIFALSYNMLLGQTGMLSFGHAVYYGLGAYFTVHAINWAIAAKLPIPLILMPLVGGAAGLAFAMLFGWVSTKRSGTAFAMISLGLAELVGSSALILRSFFGGEEGVSTNRTKLLRLFDWNFGSQIQIYYLITAWCLVCAGLLYALTRTPFGRMCNAVRDNPERAQFVGYNPQMVRYIAFCLSGLFAGIAGGLVSINFELANSALFGATQSGNVLLATFIGGTSYFIGPILGAVLVTYLQTMLSDITELWQLYFGLMFMAAVMYAPSGMAGLIMMHAPIWRAGALTRLVPSYLAALVPIALIATGSVTIVEMVAHLFAKSAEGSMMRMAGLVYDIRTWQPWVAAIGALAAGGMLWWPMWVHLDRSWDSARAVARQKGLVI
jgi:branched-chain amino acid transport system permease protein